MKLYNSWLERKKASLCILAGICAVSLFVIINSADKIKENTGGLYAVKIRHYGVNAAEIEKTVTIPLEDAIYSIAGVMNVQSTSENGLSSIFISFRSGTKGRYEAVRDAAQRVYETLPSSAQRPEIISSGNSRAPVWAAAVVNKSSNTVNETALSAQMLERIVKPGLESLEGAAEVIVSGAGLNEIFITLDQEKLDILGLEPAAVASFLAMNDSIFSGGTFFHANKEIIVSVDGRADQLNTAFIPAGDGKYIRLSEIARITEQDREPDILSRLNGSKTASIAVMGRNGADLRKLSYDIKKELANLSLPLEFTVLSDLGAEEASALRSVLNAALSGAIMVALTGFLLNRKNNFYIAAFFCARSFSCALAIPLICLISAAVLSILGFSLDRLLLAGIAAGTGTAIDAVILCSEKLRKCNDYKTASFSLTKLTGPLFAGSATTVAALLPLSSYNMTALNMDGVNIIASAISAVTIISLVLSLTLLPPVLLWDLNSCSMNKNNRTDRKPGWLSCKLKFYFASRFISRGFFRLLGATVRFCACYPVIVLSAGVIITVSAVMMLFAKGADTGSYGSEDSVYGQVEFDGGLLAEEVDRLLTVYSEQLLKIQGIKNVETGARTGTGTLLISFDPKLIKTHIVRDSAKQINIPGGFIFFNENSANDRYWEIIIYGDEDQKCMELAEEFAFLCADHPLIRERVLNFKQGSKKMTLIPDRDKFAELNISFSSAASAVRLGVYGPVAYKRMDSDGETDVRIRTGSDVTRQSREVIPGLLVSSGNGASSSLQIGSLTRIRDETEPSGIRRDNRRRAASVTIATKPMDPRRVKQELAFIFDKLDLPPGYSIEFDPQAVKQSESLSSTVISLVLAIVFCYMIIASINESFAVPLLVLSAVPPSLAIPALCLALSGSAYNSAAACAFIAVSGMTVNAAILCVDGYLTEIKKGKTGNALSIYYALRNKIPALLATTGTTIAGAVPFLFLAEGANTLIRILSLVGALGVASSFVCSVTVIPALLTITKFSQNFFLFNNLSRLSGM